jgi:DNA-binding MarR family transcriptional regulator
MMFRRSRHASKPWRQRSGLRPVTRIDQLESHGLLERRPHETDRWSYTLHSMDAGRSTLQSMGRIAREHEHALLATLSEDEQRHLGNL